MKTTTIKCKCGTDFETREIEGWKGMFESRTCNDCTARARAEEAVEIQRSRDHHAAFLAGQVDGMTPERLLTPDIMHPEFNLDLWRKVTEWHPTREKPWLGIIGATGESKTRCAFLRLRQFAMADAQAWDGRGNAPNLDALAISGMRFNKLVVEQHSNAALPGASLTRSSASVGEVAAGILRKARKADILILDELGKVKPTAGTVNEFFDLIDHRSARNLLTIWTSNTRPEQFCAAWGEEYGAPGAGRIIEASTIFKA